VHQLVAEQRAQGVWFDNRRRAQPQHQDRLAATIARSDGIDEIRSFLLPGQGPNDAARLQPADDVGVFPHDLLDDAVEPQTGEASEVQRPKARLAHFRIRDFVDPVALSPKAAHIGRRGAPLGQEHRLFDEVGRIGEPVHGFR